LKIRKNADEIVFLTVMKKQQKLESCDKISSCVFDFSLFENG